MSTADLPVVMEPVRAYLDRANISFGARDLLADTGLGDAQYGLGGSAFFVGYATMQLPSLCGARRFGAPRWLAFILFCWGVTSMSFAALRGAGGAAEFTFYALRLLLGQLWGPSGGGYCNAPARESSIDVLAPSPAMLCRRTWRL